MIIGNFTQQNGTYTGNILALGCGVRDVAFRPVPAKTGNAPDFVVLATPFEGKAEFELGAAWQKTSKAGKAYLSVKLDGPTLVQPINCALTQQQDGSYVLVWNREARKVDEAAAA